MARNIAADLTECWRAVMVWKDPDGKLHYTYEGIYNKPGTAKGRITFWRGQDRHWLKYFPEQYNSPGRYVYFYDGWIEKATITWHKEKD